MPKQLELYPEDAPYALSNSAVIRASTTARGDVEIARDNGDSHRVLTVIPKAKRAELAQFLVSAE
jgi:hypothetical protein